MMAGAVSLSLAGQLVGHRSWDRRKGFLFPHLSSRGGQQLEELLRAVGIFKYEIWGKLDLVTQNL